MNINRIFIIVPLFILFMGCKSQKMSSVEEEREVPERETIQHEQLVDVEVEGRSEIMSVEESFTFARDEDKSMHDDQGYFVIIGSFRNEDNADRYSETLKNKGFEPVILLSETGYHRVCVNSFDLEDEARNRIMHIRNNYPEHEDTWLLIRK